MDYILDATVDSSEFDFVSSPESEDNMIDDEISEIQPKSIEYNRTSTDTDSNESLPLLRRTSTKRKRRTPLILKSSDEDEPNEGHQSDDTISYDRPSEGDEQSDEQNEDQNDVQNEDQSDVQNEDQSDVQNEDQNDVQNEDQNDVQNEDQNDVQNEDQSDDQRSSTSDNGQSVHTTSESDHELNIKDVVQEFKKKIKRYGISQRQASSLILKCSQSTLSEAIAKANKLKTSKNLTPRGREIFIHMEEWTKSKDMQKKTMTDNVQQKMARRATSNKKTTSRLRRGEQFSYLQLCVLVELYKKNPRPSSQRKQLISETLNIDEGRITTWFNNQRVRNFSAKKQVEKMRQDQQPVNIPQSWDLLLNPEGN